MSSTFKKIFIIMFFIGLTTSTLSVCAVNKYDKNYVKGEVYFNNEENKPVIVDLDMAGDIDDVCAFRIATELDDEEVIDLKMIAFSVNGGEEIIKAADGMLTHDKISDVLIGKCNNTYTEESTYWDIMSEYYSGEYEVLDSVEGYRKVLAESDRRVDIITTGYTVNLEKLLKSKSDKYSKLNGVELIKKKVGQLYITGGAYTNGFDNNFMFGEGTSEAAAYVNDNWPLPIVYFINNQANMLTCGDMLQLVDVNKEDIVTKSLLKWGTEYGRAAWDPFAVWCASYGLDEICKVNAQRALTKIDKDTGENTFTLAESGKNYLVFRDPYIENEYYNEQLNNILVSKFYNLYR